MGDQNGVVCEVVERGRKRYVLLCVDIVSVVCIIRGVLNTSIGQYIMTSVTVYIASIVTGKQKST